MSAPRPAPIFTIDQYLAYERSCEDRHEYLDGQIFGMSGESRDHALISVNAVVSLSNHLRDGPCELYTKDMKVRSGRTPMKGESTSGLFSYPDIVVVCGGPEFHDKFTDVLLNPTAIFEVLSPSTEAFDRGIKFTRYQSWNPSLQDYLLISQFEPKIEHHHRESDGAWTMRAYAGLDAVVPIPSLRCSLKLVDVYARIEWE